METKHSSFNIVKAVSDFSKKMERFNFSNPQGTPSKNLSDDDIRQSKVEIHEQAYHLSVINQYKKYRFPYKTLGKASSEAESIASDEQELLAAYNLYKSIIEANAQYRTAGTFIRDNVVSCPLAKIERYAYGDDFVYLQCWLYFEQSAKDYIPVLVSDDKGNKFLTFASIKSVRFDYKDKEIVAIIKNSFYPGDKSFVY